MTSIEQLNPELEGIGRYDFGWHDPDAAGASAQRGLSDAVVRDISGKKNEVLKMNAKANRNKSKLN